MTEDKDEDLTDVLWEEREKDREEQRKRHEYQRLEEKEKRS